jgi:hypothetical protein
MKFWPRIIAAVLIAGIGFLAGAYRGVNKGVFNAGLQENKIAAACLRADDLSLSPEFREYLKGRIYYNLASKYPNDRGYLLRRDWDFGPVDLGVLKRRIYAKDPNFPSESFDSATSHLSRAEPVGEANRSQPVRSETNQTSSAAGSDR